MDIPPQVNILVLGGTGTGKTSLIHSVSGQKAKETVVPAEKLRVFHTGLVNFMERNEPVEVDSLPTHFQNFERMNNFIHNIWYCIDGSNDPVCKNPAFFSKIPDKILVVVLKSDLMNQKQTEVLMNMLCSRMDPRQVVFVSAEFNTGLAKLMDRTGEHCTQYFDNKNFFTGKWKKQYRAARNQWKRNSEIDADAYIFWAAMKAAMIAQTSSLLDFESLITNETHLLYKIACLYGIVVDKTQITIIRSFTEKWTVKTVSSAAKITYAVGKVAQVYFESNMALTPKELRNKFEESGHEAERIDWGSMVARQYHRFDSYMD